MRCHRLFSSDLGKFAVADDCLIELKVYSSGAKGVLGCWPNLASDQEVRLRDSTIKFKSDLTDLNVVRVSYEPIRYQWKRGIDVETAR